jgi:hypothetical protein
VNQARGITDPDSLATVLCTGRLTQRYYIDLRIADTKKALEGVPEIGATAKEPGHPKTAHGG